MSDEEKLTDEQRKQKELERKQKEEQEQSCNSYF